jgi:hypothetical protein
MPARSPPSCPRRRHPVRTGIAGDGALSSVMPARSPPSCPRRRASTSCFLPRGHKEDVDGRDEPGHDGGGISPRASAFHHHARAGGIQYAPASRATALSPPSCPRALLRHARAGGHPRLAFFRAATKEDVDGRDEPGHDAGRDFAKGLCLPPSCPRRRHPVRTGIAGRRRSLLRHARALSSVMPAQAGIHVVLPSARPPRKTWMAGTGPAMTAEGLRQGPLPSTVMPAPAGIR